MLLLVSRTNQLTNNMFFVTFENEQFVRTSYFSESQQRKNIFCSLYNQKQLSSVSELRK